ncbi:DUF2339 domain-containing protein [Erythrobacter sp. Alg231-14]|uniref:DUF2339 domain-containing protein n=1 Tax=Erythrobacter sp. Alg231-14 TaxID=1922225 RepID=UPI000D56267B
MEMLLILLLGGAVAYSWTRIDRLERQVIDLYEWRYGGDQSVESSAAEPAAAPIAPEPENPVLQPIAAKKIVEPSVQSEELIAPKEEVASEPAPDPENTHETEPEAEPEAEPEVMGEPLTAPPTGPAIAASTPDTEPQEVGHDDATEHQSHTGFSFDFEDIFGRRLPIWGGGFALAIAGIFLVRFSIEAGLLTPTVRVAMSFVFGVALLIGAETAFRFEGRLRDPRVRQALAGAGLATLYGAFYLAGTGYGLIGSGPAFVGLAVVTALAIGLSFRFGLPSAVIGLVGGFAAPMLVDSDSANVPLLSFYLALITGGLAWTGKVQGRKWLGYMALTAGLCWGGLMMFAGVSNASDFAALGLYLVILGTLLPALLNGKDGPGLPILAAGSVATLQVAALVSSAGFDPLTWGLYLLIGAALSALGWRHLALRLGAFIAAGLGLWLLLIWPDPNAQFFAVIAVSFLAIFVGLPLTYQGLDRANVLDCVQLAVVPFILGVVLYVQFGSWGALRSEPILAACLAGLSALPVIGFAMMWRRDEELETRKSLGLIISGAALAFAALLLLTPAWIAPVMATIVAAPILWCNWRREVVSVTIAAWASAATVIIALLVTPDFANEITQIGDAHVAIDMARAALRWAAAALPFVCLALISRSAAGIGVAEAFAVALIYAAIAQIVPSAALAWIAAIGAIGLFIGQSARISAWTTASVIAGLWAFLPMATWGTTGLMAVLGEPFLLEGAITPMDLALRVLPIGACLAVFYAKGQGRRVEFISSMLAFLIILTVAMVHSLYKQAFSIATLFEFEHYAMGERTVWQAALLLVAYGVWQGSIAQSLRRPVASVILAASLAHFVWFTLVLHNPLFSVQHVGPTPVANWLSLAYAVALGALWLAQIIWADAHPLFRRALDAVRMALIALLGLSLLRHVFAGSVLTAGSISQTESLLISLLGILLALGYLWWGSWRDQRSWRIGSLVLMLAAVVKVFLIDAAGLEGLLRIASFMALGFSLIGIGWVYSRQLYNRNAAQS